MKTKITIIALAVLGILFFLPKLHFSQSLSTTAAAKTTVVTPTFKQAKNYVALPSSTLPVKAAVVLDTVTGQIIYQYNANEVLIPASLTKLVASLVFLDQKPNLSKIITLKDDDEVGGGRLRVVDGSKFSLKDALYSALIGSANNTTMAIANSTGLASSTFVAKMNQKALALGTAAHFNEPAGMDASNTASCLDMAKIARASFLNTIISTATRLWKYTFIVRNTGVKKTLTNTNSLVGQKRNFYIYGSKTGYLVEAGNNLAIRAKAPSGQGDIIVVTMGSGIKQESFAAVKKITDWVFKNYTWTSSK